MTDIANIIAQIEDEWDCVMQKGDALFIRDNQETVYTVLKLDEQFIVTNCKLCMIWVLKDIEAVINIIR